MLCLSWFNCKGLVLRAQPRTNSFRHWQAFEAIPASVKRRSKQFEVSSLIVEVEHFRYRLHDLNSTHN